jgi:2-iminoacetate synthase
MKGIRNILAEKSLDRAGQRWQEYLQKVTPTDIGRALFEQPGLYRFEKLAALISPAAEDYLEQMAQAARQLTIQRFGRTIRLYAPLYLSNYCG